jgi:hypothetical protein
MRNHSPSWGFYSFSLPINEQWPPSCEQKAPWRWPSWWCIWHQTFSQYIWSLETECGQIDRSDGKRD